jgi:hypothetical protein
VELEASDADLIMNEWTEKWAEYQKWVDAHAEPDRRLLHQIMADLEFLHRVYPQSVRQTDPEKPSVQHLYRVFAICDRELRSRSGADAGH